MARNNEKSFILWLKCDWLIDWLIDCLLLNVPLEKKTKPLPTEVCKMSAFPRLFNLWAETPRDLSRFAPADTRAFFFFDLFDYLFQILTIKTNGIDIEQKW